MDNNNNNTKIGGRTYSFGTIPPTEAVRVEVAIARVIGEPLFRAFMDTKGSGKAKDIDPQQAGITAIGLMASRMDADELLATMQTVFKYVSVDGARCIFEEHFAGRNREMWQVFIAALRYNFSDFLPESLFASLPFVTAK